MYSLLIVSVCLFGSALADENTGDQDYFSQGWRQEYDDGMIARQPKWKLAEDQPATAAYEVRVYSPAWWVSSYSPCLNQTVAAQMGYLQIYIYVNRYNSEYAKYNLTYPILNKVELNTRPDGKDTRVACPDRYSVHLYLQHPLDDVPAEGLNEYIMTSKDENPRRRFVRRYNDEFDLQTNDDCNQEAGLLAADLALDGRRFDPNTYYCALYKEGKSGNHGFEVWFDENAE